MGDSLHRGQRRRVMRRREARELIEKTSSITGEISPAIVEQVEAVDGAHIYLFDGVASLIGNVDAIFPTLKSPFLDRLPSVVVDMRAVPHICNGADVMAPGIVEVGGDFELGSLLVVRDVRHNKALAIGSALLSSEEIRLNKKGKAVKNLHYVGDKLWKAYA